MKTRWLIVAMLVLAGCSEQQIGKQLFENHCAECHQSSGKGRYFFAVPANAGTDLDRDMIARLLTEGMASHDNMPVFPTLSRQQAYQIADYLLTL